MRDAAESDAVVREHVRGVFQIVPDFRRAAREPSPQSCERRIAAELLRRARITVRERHIRRFARRDAEREPAELGAHVAVARGLDDERRERRGLELRDPMIELESARSPRWKSKPRVTATCAPSGAARIALGVEPGEAGICAGGAPLSGHAGAARSRGDVERLRGWLASKAARRRVGHDLKARRARVGEPRGRGSRRHRERHDARVVCLELDGRESRARRGWRRVTRALETLKYEEVAGKGAKQLAFDQVTCASATYSGRGADVTLRLHPGARRRHARCPSSQTCTEIELPLLPCSSAWSTRACCRPADAARAEQELATRMAAPSGPHKEAGCAIQPRFAEAAPRDPVREVHCRCSARRRPGSRRRPKTCSKSSPSSYACRGSSSSTAPQQAQVHLHRQAARRDQPRHRAACTRPTSRRWRRPGGCPRQIRICRTFRSARPKAGASARRSSRPAASAARGRLLADRAADHGAPVRRRRLARRVRERDRTSTRRPPRRYSACRSKGDRRSAPLGQGHQLRPHLRHVARSASRKQLGIERGAGAGYIERYFERYPGVKRYMDETPRSARERGYVENGVRPAAVSARHQRAQRAAPPVRRARRDQRAHAGHRGGHHQARDDRGGGWLARRGAARRSIMQVHDELVSRCSGASMQPVRARPSDESWRAPRRLAVPLRVDIGVGGELGRGTLSAKESEFLATSADSPDDKPTLRRECFR